MARYSGVVGFGENVETPPGSGNWVDVMTERPYRGDVVRNTSRPQTGDKVNDDIVVVNQLRIVADDYAIEHYSDIKYVSWLGDLWTVTSVEVQVPRLTLSLGSVYNGPTPA